MASTAKSTLWLACVMGGILLFLWRAPAAEAATFVDDMENPENPIGWVRDFEEAKRIGRENRRPIVMVIAGNDDDPCCEMDDQCRSIKEMWRTSKEIRQHTKNFVMLLLHPDDEPDLGQFSPFVAGHTHTDADAVHPCPRMLFFRPNGQFLPAVINGRGHSRHAKHRLYYDTVEEVVHSMHRTLRLSGLQIPVESGRKTNLHSDFLDLDMARDRKKRNPVNLRPKEEL